MRIPIRLRCCAGLLIALAVLVLAPASASASEPGSVWWGVNTGSRPLAKPGEMQLYVTADNLGYEPAEGASSPVEVSAAVPGGLHVISVKAFAGKNFGEGQPLTCVSAKVTCTDTGALPPYKQIEMLVTVKIEPGVEPVETVSASASGGGAVRAGLASHEVHVEAAPTFGYETFSMIPEGAGGGIDTQAGSHPFQFTTTVTWNPGPPEVLEGVNPVTHEPIRLEEPRSAGLAKNVVTELPPGFFGNPTPFAQCTGAEFAQQAKTPNGQLANECPAASAIGVATVSVNEPKSHFSTSSSPVFNMTPLRGEPARFGFLAAGIFPVFLSTAVRTGSDYGITVSSLNTPEIASTLSAKVTIWGVPGDARHNNQRGYECLQAYGSCPAGKPIAPPPFLTMPASCQAPFQATARGNSWGSSEVASEEAQPLPYTLPQAIDGCNRLPFAPSIQVTPDIPHASTSTGLDVAVHVPQTAALNAEGLAESTLRDTTVTLPEGVAVNPSGGNGLQACSESLVGYLAGESVPPEQLRFTPRRPGSFGSAEPFEPGVDFCPDASKIGTVKISTPLLPNALEGAVYLATQNQNPFGSLIAMYAVAEDPVSGTLIKLPFSVAASPSSGRLVATSENSPDLPFETAEFHFFGGERAPLATPARCGPYTTTASLTPWSGNEPVTASSTFNITSGPGASACPGASLPFSPSLTGGSTNINAGGFSPLTTTISRADGQQNMQQVTLHMPAGLEGLLSNVKLCPEAQANEGTCGPESEIGETTVSAGVGSDPVSVTGGRVYITEHYAGAPFGLSIVNPVKAGPFDLEHDTANPAQDPPCDCVVVRARIEVNPVTAELTITTDESGAHAIPHLIDGIPVQIKAVNVLVNREHFTFNPTNCNPLSLTGTIASDEGASSPVSVPFQATNCAVLKYTPTLTVSTAAKASKTNGASLFFKIAYPKGAVGTQSWMKEMKFDIPKQLPARLTTIQKACLAATFEHNRGACPPASIIGHLIVHTPVLPVPLEGPLYFVSYGGAAFPDAVAVLHGYGLTIESHGKTFINGKTGVTSATFDSVPDVPFESIEVTVPQGPFSEFGANLPNGGQSFCGQKLVMPILFKAQNGMEIHQNVPVGVTGCPKGLTNKQKLAAALKACHKKHGKKRATCEKAARKAYGARKASVKKSSRKGHR